MPADNKKCARPCLGSKTLSDKASAPSSPESSTKVKNKKKLPPQETVNTIWERFSVAKPGKVITILPSSQPTTKSSPDPTTTRVPKTGPNNVLVSEDYDRAAAECRNRVQKLIKECRRLNMRYQDPDFDIDMDWKRGMGYCLNGLTRERFDISRQTLANPNSHVPKAAKRVHEIFLKPTFLGQTPSSSDVVQGSLGDCWLISALSILANVENGIERLCVEYDTKFGIYGFVFHRDGEWIISIIDDKLYLKSPDWDSPAASIQRKLLERTDRDRDDAEKHYRETYQTGSQALFFARCTDQNETWVPLMEKAYAKAHGDYSALHGGSFGEALEDLTAGVNNEFLTSDVLDTEEFWNDEILQVNKKFMFGCCLGIYDAGNGNRGGIQEAHDYSVIEAREISTGQRLVKIRNPWGSKQSGNWTGAWSDGSKELTPAILLELNHSFGNDSCFWISFEDFLRKFQHVDRTRLFMESRDWHTTQKWVSMSVPWKPEFEEKFRVVLTKESPLVLVLSQLDDRYFKGLTGQYWFDLQFRVHEVGSVDGNDYIVRSHGNHLLDRSVVVELKSLPSGVYSIFVKVNATRGCSCCYPSVEEVLKEQCRHREENDKLAQVGMSYDYAHGKVASYIKQKEKLRKSQEKSKAREVAFAQQRRAWEKRHLARKLLRKQKAKNKIKLDERKVRLEAEAKLKKEASGEDSEEKQTGDGEPEKEKCGNEACPCKVASRKDGKSEAASSVVDKIEGKKPKDEAIIEEKSKVEISGREKLLEAKSEKDRDGKPSTVDKSVQTESPFGAIVSASIDARDKNHSTNFLESDAKAIMTSQGVDSTAHTTEQMEDDVGSASTSGTPSGTEVVEQSLESSPPKQVVIGTKTVIPRIDIAPQTAESEDTGVVTKSPATETTGGPVEGLNPDTDEPKGTSSSSDDALQTRSVLEQIRDGGNSEAVNESSVIEEASVLVDEQKLDSMVAVETETTMTLGDTAEMAGMPEQTADTAQTDTLIDLPVTGEAGDQKDEPNLTSIESGGKVMASDGTPLTVGIPARKDESVQTDCISISSSSDPALDTPNGSSIANSPREEKGFIEASRSSSALSMQENVPGPASSSQEGSVEKPKKTPGPLVYESDGDSSDSPVSDFDEMFSDSDDDIPRPTPAVVKKPDVSGKTDKKDEDDEDAKEEAKLPSPWNAVCIIGFRVYSKDAELRLTIYEGDEGGEAKKVEGPNEDQYATHKDTEEFERIEDTEVISGLDSIGQIVKDTEADPLVKI